MAAALVGLGLGGRIDVRSAGSSPAEEINPSVVSVMSELGVDLSREAPKALTDDAVRASDVVITMGCGDACPIFPGSATRTGSSGTRRARTSTPCAGSATRSTHA